MRAAFASGRIGTVGVLPMSLEIAFYGAGSRAQSYLDVLARRTDAKVVAVCDVERRLAEQVAAGWQAQVYLSYEAMLRERRLDAIWICVAPHLQGDVILRAVEARVPFFVEPPGAIDYERARVYHRLVADTGLVAAVGFATRHIDIVQEGRGYLGANPVPLALGWWMKPAAEEKDSSAASLLWTDACRLVDAVRHFCGEVVSVHAVTPATTNQALVVQLQFAGGGVGVLSCASFARPEPRVELEMLGDGWSLSLGTDLADLRLVERDRSTTLRRLNHAAVQQVATFLEAIRTRDANSLPSTYQAALPTLTICHAAAVSARLQAPVRIADVEHLQLPSEKPAVTPL